MMSEDLIGLDADALSLIEQARSMHEPGPGVQARVRGKLKLSLAAGASVAWYGAAASATAAKLLAAALSVGMAGTGLWYAEQRSGPRRPASPAAKSVLEASPRAAAASPLNAELDVTGAAPATSASGTHSAVSARPALHAELSNSERIGGLAAETQVLTLVNAALNRHDGAAALSLLDDYDQRFKSRILFAERSAARVFALCSLGHAEAARAGAERFLRRFPHSPLVGRILASCAGPLPAKPAAP